MLTKNICSNSSNFFYRCGPVDDQQIPKRQCISLLNIALQSCQSEDAIEKNKYRKIGSAVFLRGSARLSGYYHYKNYA